MCKQETSTSQFETNRQLKGSIEPAVDHCCKKRVESIGLSYSTHYNLSYFSLTSFYTIRLFYLLDSSDRLRDVTVTVGLTESTVNIVCGFFAGPGTASQVVIIDCPTTPEGRFVKISKTTEYLSLCEVDVFGVAV